MTTYVKVKKISIRAEPGFSRTEFSYSKCCKTEEDAWCETVNHCSLGLYESIKKTCVYVLDSNGTIIHKLLPNE